MPIFFLLYALYGAMKSETPCTPLHTPGKVHPCTFLCRFLHMHIPKHSLVQE